MATTGSQRRRTAGLSEPARHPRWAPVATLALVLVGAGLALFSEFGLNSWASVSQLGDWVQHGVIFWGGIAVGVGVTGLYHQGRRRR